MHLIDNIDLVFSGLRGKPYLLHQRPDIVHGIVAGSIQLVDIQRDPVVKGYTGMALVTGLAIRRYILTINGLGKYTGTSSFADSPGSAKEEGMRQLVVPDGIFKSGRDMRLANHRRKTLWPVFSRRNNKFIH